MSVRETPPTDDDFRFPRQRRLLKPEAFSRVFRDGFRSADSFFTLLAVRNDCQAPRLGLAVSRKVSPTAAGRNRIKRQVRESFRVAQAHLPAIDIVVMAKRDAVAADNARLRQSLERHWLKLSKRATECEAS